MVPERARRRLAVMALAAAGWLVGVGEPHAGRFPPSTQFAIHCQGCHGAAGEDVRGLVPPLAGSVGRFLAAPGGREFLVQVPGVAMTHLDDEDLAALLGWMLERFAADDRPPGFIPYSAAEVARLRRDPLIDVKGVRRKLVAHLEDERLPLPVRLDAD